MPTPIESSRKSFRTTSLSRGRLPSPLVDAQRTAVTAQPALVLHEQAQPKLDGGPATLFLELAAALIVVAGRAAHRLTSGAQSVVQTGGPGVGRSRSAAANHARRHSPRCPLRGGDGS
jgi:hypothetical protein